MAEINGELDPEYILSGVILEVEKHIQPTWILDTIRGRNPDCCFHVIECCCKPFSTAVGYVVMFGINPLKHRVHSGKINIRI